MSISECLKTKSGVSITLRVVNGQLLSQNDELRMSEAF